MLGTDSEHGNADKHLGWDVVQLGVLAGVGTIEEGRYHWW